ncbi:MAG: serine/threonine protein phosphatase [Erysipelotrichaceae bacterium]|nr:serine/threonine protein phosphatase [Erysipelotrichaceae bacterium]
MANKTYVISDLHGHYQVFLKMLKKIEFSDSDLMYILGDVCDRGPQSLDIYLDIRKRPNVKLIRGNHEIMMRNSFMEDNKGRNSFRMWSQNGGRKTIENYHEYLGKGKIAKKEYLKKREIFINDMIDYVNKCPSFVEITVNHQQFVLIHAGINPEKTLYEQTEEECAWMREWFYMSPALKDKLIIFGHTPTCFIKQTDDCNVWFDPEFKDKIGIDGGLGSFDYGQLNCLCLDTMEIFVVTKKEVYQNE